MRPVYNMAGLFLFFTQNEYGLFISLHDFMYICCNQVGFI